MPGFKICPKCKLKNGPRQRICKCSWDFVIAKKEKAEKQSKIKEKSSKPSKPPVIYKKQEMIKTSIRNGISYFLKELGCLAIEEVMKKNEIKIDQWDRDWQDGKSGKMLTAYDIAHLLYKKSSTKII